MDIEIGEVLSSAIEREGAVMDFIGDEFVFVIRDEVWMGEGCRTTKHNPSTLNLVYKYDIAVFLPTLEDAVDASGFTFNVHDSEHPEYLYHGSKNGGGYDMALYLINSTNTVCAKRCVRLSQGMPDTVSQYLAKQRQAPFMEEEFLCNLQGLQSTWEPFEIQKMALGSETFK